MVIGALLGVAVQGGRSLLSLGVVDLTKADILWTHHTLSIVNDMTDRTAVGKMLEEILASYPGLDSA